MTTTEPAELKPFLAALKNYQQADMDGVMVLVSRQAVDETLAYIKTLTPPAPVADDAAEDNYIKDQMVSHPDSRAVERFAKAMKLKLWAKRQEGYSGWDRPEECTVDFLADMLVKHVAKGDPVDVANFCMMLHQRRADRDVLSKAAQGYHLTRPTMTEAELEREAEELAITSRFNGVTIDMVKAMFIDLAKKFRG